MAQLFVGTSGWNYIKWRGSFYPSTLPAKQLLAFYVKHFRSAEVNYSFYQLPSKSTYENWYATVPDDFVFALKLSRYITHIRRLNDVQKPWNDFLEGARILKEKLGPVLMQFPPNFKCNQQNLGRVADFLAYTSKDGIKIAMEFRDRSCFSVSMLSLLTQYNVALVLSHSCRYPVPELSATASFVYFRFHGPREWCSSCYSDTELRPWADYIRRSLHKGMDSYAYFNNDAHGDAPPNAKLLNSMVG